MLAKALSKPARVLGDVLPREMIWRIRPSRSLGWQLSKGGLFGDRDGKV